MNQKLKKAGSIAILSTMLVGLLPFVPVVSQALSTAFKWGSTYSDLHAQVENHANQIKENKNMIKNTETRIREFRSVWCLDRLSSNANISNEVLKSCSEWIRNP